MDLSWIAAVLQPNDVAPHPNFRDDSYDRRPSVILAALVLGRDHPVDLVEAITDVRSRPDTRTQETARHLELAQRCLLTETIHESVEELSRVLVNERVHDVAEAAALSLVLCAAAGELDDFATCQRVLDAQLGLLGEPTTADKLLIQAVLLQQQAFRLRDEGTLTREAYVRIATEVRQRLDQLSPSECSGFETNRGVSWTSQSVITDIRNSLIDAAGSLIPPLSTDRKAVPPIVPSWQERVRSRPSPVMLRYARNRASTLGKHLDATFRYSFDSPKRHIGGTAQVDLFHTSLQLELVGHALAGEGRRELAQLRLLQSRDDDNQVADALRLLRQSPASDELSLVLRRVRFEGPLASLGTAARQVVSRRREPHHLRTVELAVLEASADLLAPAEARLALSAVQDTLASGGPRDLPGQHQLEVIRRETAWTAAAALSNVCDAPSEVTELILNVLAETTSGDELLDRAAARALDVIEWTGVEEPTRRRWTNFLDQRQSDFPIAAQIFYSNVDTPRTSSTPPASISDIARRLGDLARTDTSDKTLQEAVPLVRDQLARTREQAAKGTFTLGTVKPAQLAVGLIRYGQATNLWRDLAGFLIDPSVSRSDKSPAFDQLAHDYERFDIPSYARERLQNSADSLLHEQPQDQRSGGLFVDDPPINPYPHALRLLAVAELIDQNTVYDATTQLAANSRPTARREAARTVALLAAHGHYEQLEPLALALAGDADVQVRAHAGRSLTYFARHENHPASTIALARLVTLLNADGILTPLTVLRELTGQAPSLPVLRGLVRELASEHPARRVRIEAGRLLTKLDAEG